MPIQCSLTIRPIANAEFNEIDRSVMGCAYASQNALGRLCDEQVYENDLALRLRAEGLAEVETQVPVTVAHNSFRKTYRLDLIVNQMVYELKAAVGFTSEHEAQAIHYAGLLALDRVKLLKFDAAKVQGKLIGTPFARIDRRQVRYGESRWQPLSERCAELKQQMCALLADWGAFLETPLYEEALMYFHGGEETCQRRIPVNRNGLKLGMHPFLCHALQLAFAVTALTEATADYEQHLRRLLSLTNLHGMQWMNLRHTEIEFVTLLNGRGIEAKE